MSTPKFTRWIQIRDYIYRNLFWMLISFSIAIFFWAYLCEDAYVRHILTQAGIAILSSGVFAAALKSRQFSGLFKEELEKIILGSEFIKNRKDLPDLWKAISKSIYREKFPHISEELERIVLEHYFPTDHDFYYKDFHVDIQITEITDDFIIKYVQTSRYTVIMSDDKTDSVLIQESEIDQESETQVVNQLDFFTINGVKQELDEDESTKSDPTKTKYVIPILGCNRYKIHSQYTREYSLSGENYKKFTMNYITDGMIVVVDFPEDVKVSFFNIGMVDSFSEHLAPRSHRISRIHEKGLILPYQGFGLSFEKCILNK